MKIKQFTVNPVQENTYVIWDEKSKEAAIIDCGTSTHSECNQLETFITSQELQLKHVLQTHCHFDHIMGVKYLYDRYQLSPRCHPLEQELYEVMPMMSQKYFGILLPEPLPPLDASLNEGDVIHIGSLQLHVIHTPGHTSGGICLYEPKEKVVFSGDTLFRGSLGRTDLGGNMMQELASIRKKILTLPSDTLILPGHGPQTNVAWEKENNPYVIAREGDRKKESSL